VPLAPCSYCRQRSDAKLSQVTWAWLNAARERVAWRQKLCVACFVQNVLGLDKEVDLTAPLSCPACGIGTEHDYDAVYITSFIPGQGKMRLELPTCGACAAIIRGRAMENAERLEDRLALVEGPGPSNTDTSDPWAALGIRPRD